MIKEHEGITMTRYWGDSMKALPNDVAAYEQELAEQRAIPEERIARLPYMREEDNRDR